jgi:hypothetical protein
VPSTVTAFMQEQYLYLNRPLCECTSTFWGRKGAVVVLAQTYNGNNTTGGGDGLPDQDESQQYIFFERA